MWALILPSVFLSFSILIWDIHLSGWYIVIDELEIWSINWLYVWYTSCNVMPLWGFKFHGIRYLSWSVVIFVGTLVKDFLLFTFQMETYSNSFQIVMLNLLQSKSQAKPRNTSCCRLYIAICIWKPEGIKKNLFLCVLYSAQDTVHLMQIY